jgi:uncharacterized protein (TIGR02391 family)
MMPTFDAQRLEAIARVLADTDSGLTGSQIGYLLADSKIPDVDPTNTKWKRLFNAFIEFQNQHQVGNHVVVFITRAMSPASYTERPHDFKLRQDRLNTVLSFCGLYVGDNGKVRKASAATTLDEAAKRASRLRAALLQRNVHDDVLAFCNKELLEENYFHAVFEAMKSVTAKLRRLSGSTGDGADLVHVALGMKNGAPKLAINALDTETLRGEQRGFVSLLKGLYGTIRNPLAHDPKVEWDMNEQDAMDVLTMISLVHRKLDKATPWPTR